MRPSSPPPAAADLKRKHAENFSWKNQILLSNTPPNVAFHSAKVAWRDRCFRSAKATGRPALTTITANPHQQGTENVRNCPIDIPVDQTRRASFQLAQLGKASSPTRPLARDIFVNPLVCHWPRQCLADTRQFHPSPNPSGKNSTPPSPVFPEKNSTPSCSRYLKTSKTRSHETEQKIGTRRKTPVQTNSIPQKCSTIRAQQFPRGPVNSGTSRPPLVQIFNPKTRINDERAREQARHSLECQEPRAPRNSFQRRQGTRTSLPKRVVSFLLDGPRV
jgi:hypothetical protein